MQDLFNRESPHATCEGSKVKFLWMDITYMDIYTYMEASKKPKVTKIKSNMAIGQPKKKLDEKDS